MKTDVLIIGGGPGGYVAALRAAQLGAQVTLVERQELGGVCLNVGCIPTKALLASADVYDLTRRADEFGIHTAAPVLDWPAMQARKAKVVQRMVSGVQVLLKKAGVTVLRGHGRFTAPRSVSVEGDGVSEQVEADHIVIATGSRSATIPVPGLDSPRVLDSTGALSLPELPASIIIIGAGAIGVEFASLFHALGVEVTVVEMLPRLLPLMDADLGEALARLWRRRKLRALTGARLKEVQDSGEHLDVQIETASGVQAIQAAKLLLAVGRRPNVENLGLEEAGVEYSRKGIAVDAMMRTNVPHIYAIGDVVGGVMLAHWASHMGIAAVENALGGHVELDGKGIPACVFCQPEVASIGLTEEEARDKGYDVRLGTFPFLASGKAVAAGETDGFVKVVAEGRYNEVLGVHIIGPHASDLIMPGSLALTLEATLDEFRETIPPHPTLGEAIHEAALAAMGIPLHMPASKR